MNRYDLTHWAKITASIRGNLLHFFLAGLWAFLVYALYASPEKLTGWRLWYAYAFFGVSGITILFSIVNTPLQVFRGSMSISVGRDWIELPEIGRVGVSEIRAIKTRFSPFHRRFIIVLKRKASILTHMKCTIRPYWYRTASGLGGQIERIAAEVQPNLGVPADRDPRERGSRPLNTDR